MTTIQQIQTLAGVTADGMWGPLTSASVNRQISSDADFVKRLQAILGVTPDGDWGPISEAALQAVISPSPAGPRSVMASSFADPADVAGMKPTWTYRVDGDDLCVDDILATCFGGAYDSGDDGQTESGIPNDGSDPTLMGVALPIRSTEAATVESPLAFKGPRIPWGAQVNVWRTVDGESRAVVCKLIDNGPDVRDYPNHALDLNPNVAAYFAPDFDPKKLANEWSGEGFSYRIIGGAKYIS